MKTSWQWLKVIVLTGRAGRDLPVSPESQFIQTVIEARYPPPAEAPNPRRTSRASPVRFARFSFERHCLEQCLLILTQIPAEERPESYGRETRIVVGPEFGVYGVVFQPARTSGQTQGHYIVRLRCNDLEKLQKATVSFASAADPAKAGRRSISITSRAASVGRRVPPRTPFTSTVTRLEVRSVANELLFRGDVVPIRSRLTLLRHTLANRSARVLAWISVVLIGLSAVLFFIEPEAGWWHWAEQMAGRLATGAFGALLVDGALDYDALRRSLFAGTGAVTHGALIDWKRV